MSQVYLKYIVYFVELINFFVLKSNSILTALRILSICFVGFVLCWNHKI